MNVKIIRKENVAVKTKKTKKEEVTVSFSDLLNFDCINASKSSQFLLIK